MYIVHVQIESFFFDHQCFLFTSLSIPSYIHHYNSTLLTIETLTVLTVYLHEKKNIQLNSFNYNKNYLRLQKKKKKNRKHIYPLLLNSRKKELPSDSLKFTDSLLIH